MAVIEEKLSAIGNAIREKGGTTELLTLDEMPVAIGAIETGGGGADIPEEAFLITGDCQYRFAHNSWNWFIENYGDKITTKDITDAERMFSESEGIKKIPFKLNFKNNTTISLSYFCCMCNLLEQPPEFGAIKPEKMNHIFYYCHNIREFPEGYGNNIDWSQMNSQANMFYFCHSLRKIPMNLISKSNNTNFRYINSYFYAGFNGCYALDELVNLPIPYTTAAWTSNSFNSTFTNCSRLKNLTFATNEDGTPIVVTWKNQTIDLSNCVGWTNVESNILNYNSGITADKKVFDNATYQALKDDADWYTTSFTYSRYNKESAIATMNSLPDTSAYLAANGGTNTLKLKSEAGSNTDGMGMNNLGPSDIAIAAAKGWTVTRV